MSTQLLLETGCVLLRGLIVLNKFPGIGVVGVGLVQQEAKADVGKGEVCNCDLVSDNILASVSLESLINGLMPSWEHLEPVLLEDGFLLLIGFEVEFEVCSKIVFNGINSRIDLPGKLGILGVVAVGAAEVSEDSP